MPGSANATVAVGAGQGVMPAQVLGGPIWWFVFGLYVLTVALAVYMLVDSLRAARRGRLGKLPEPAWLYPVCAAAYLVSVAGVWIPVVPRIISVVPVVLTPFALAMGVVYLLRVVFPKPDLDVLGEQSEPPSEGKSSEDTNVSNTIHDSK